ncbi:MAG: Type I Iterative PKS [Cirrosporium novae-zelandiae]|nr:MAG: Type I Iterative PKS [Cirrosporium novae-zelandiae]
MDGHYGGAPEPIAIVGMGCRFPGDASSPSKLWQLLEEGRSAQSEIPKNRFNMEAWYHPDSSRPGSIPTRGGYFLSHDESYREFDPSFFGINPLEAASMDPQQRKFLEVVYESFESSGTTLADLSGSKTACYVGCFTRDFSQMNAKDPEYGIPYQMTGSDMTILSNRINYVFNLKGPSLTLDTACSSSLYALHLACQSIIAGDCTAAVVGGTNIILGIEQHIDSVRLGILSPTSTCHTFDESADGFGRGEGIAALYVKKLSAAIADKNPIRAIIRSTAVNANGKSPGINHPSSTDQETVIRDAYRKAGLDFSQTGYVECHGTGTPVGDPIEVTAVGNVFASGRSEENPLLIGSIKTNLGHTEGASGLASVMKVVLGLEHKCIPATVGIKKLNPNIDFRDGRLKVVRANTPWPELFKSRRGGVNSFGYGGANAHIIIDAPDLFLENRGTWFKIQTSLKQSQTGEALTNGHIQVKSLEEKKYLLAFSAHDQPTLNRNIQAVAKSAHKYDALDIAYTLGVRRSKLYNRAFSVSMGSDIASQLQESNVTYGSQPSAEPVLAFVFTGQGAQWPQMGYSLIQQYPSVRQTFDQLQDVLDMLSPPPEWTLIGLLAEPAKTSRVQDAALSQPLCTAVQIAVTVLLRSWGVHPAAVVGHSSGEVAASFAAGLLTAAEAISVAYYRGIAVTQCHHPGAMMAVGLGVIKVQPYVENQPDVVVACHNSPFSVTLSGGESAIDEINAALVKDGIFARKLKTFGNAYHSHLVRDAGKYYQECFESSLPSLLNAPRRSEVPMFSCITGKVLSNQNDVGIEYWRKNVESPVLFDEALQSLVTAHPTVNNLIEIGPHSALAGPIRQIRSVLEFDAERLNYIPTLIRGQDGGENVLKTAGSLFLRGYPINIERINSIESTVSWSSEEIIYKTGSHLVELPSYQWNYESIPWKEKRLSREIRFRKHCRHDILGSRDPGSSLCSPLWRNILQLKNVPWLHDHKVGDDILFPAAGYMAMAIEAVTQVAEDRGTIPEGYALQGLHITSPLVLPIEGEVETLFNLLVLDGINSKEATRWFDFKVSSVTPDNKWTEHAAGRIAVHLTNIGKNNSNIALLKECSAHGNEKSDRQWFSALSNIGLEYGPSFQTVSNINTIEERDEATARIALHSTKDIMSGESRYIIHPSSLDGCLQLSVMGAWGNVKNIVKAYLPTVIENLTIWRGPNSPPLPEYGLIQGHGTRHGLRSAHATSEMFNDEGQLLVETKGTFYSLEGGFSKQANEKPRQPYTRLIWKPDIDRLKGSPIRKLFPNGVSDPKWNTLLKQLEEISALCVLDSLPRVPKDIDMEAQPPHMQKFAKWLQSEGEKLTETESGKLSETLRKERIQELLSSLAAEVPEARMTVRLSERISDILGGKVGALDVMFEDGLLNYLYEHGFTFKAAYPQLINVVKLLAHKEPCLKVLEVGAGTGGATRPMLQALGGNSLTPQYSQYTFTDVTTAFLGTAQEKFQDFKNIEYRALNIEHDPMGQGFEANSFDLILASNVIHATENITASLQHCKALLKEGGKMILVETTRDLLTLGFMLGPLPGYWLGEKDGRNSTPFISQSAWNDRFIQAGFSGNDIVLDDYDGSASSTSVIVSTVQASNPTMNGDNSPDQLPKSPLWLIYYNEPHPVVKEIEKLAQDSGIEVHSVPLLAASEKIPKDSRAVMLAELEGPILSRMKDEQMTTLKALIKTVSSAIWVTRGGLLTGKDPEQSLVLGMAKSIVTEQPSFRLSTIDIDPDGTDHVRTANLILQHELAWQKDSEHSLDTALIEKNGMVYISRYITDDIENTNFRRQFKPIPEKQSFKPELSLDFLQVGRLDSFYFKQNLSSDTSLKTGQIIVEPQAYNLRKSEALVLKGQHDAESFSHEAVATVVTIGPDVTKVKVGDRVICLTSGKFDSSFVASEYACELLREDEDTTKIVGLLVPFCTALYALQDLGRASQGETVLIHTGAGPIYAATVTFARIFGCKTLITAGSDEEKEHLHNTFNIPENCILPANSAGLSNDVLAATEGKGVDIVLAASGAPALQDVWTCLARNGRFIFVGDDVPDLGHFDVSIFRKGASFASFDFAEMISTKPETASRLMHQVLNNYRDGKIQISSPVDTFDISELPNAVGAATRGNAFTKVVLTCSPQSIVPVQTTHKPLAFSPTATYLMIGCLGGLGRSIALWMASRGARNFVFLARSGTDKPEAATFVQKLQSFGEGMSVEVIRGDVSVPEDVDRAIAIAKSPIRGVIQAAMHLEDALFDDMSLQTFEAVTNPKVKGTLNLHKALLHEPLDFFVMTSSMLGAIGPSTQTNYAAANAFLDHMARHRYSLGLQATCIALGMVMEVGHVEAHPDVADALRRNGMYPIDEDEFLRMMELACQSRDFGPSTWGWDDCARSHLVAGLDPGRVSFPKVGGKSQWLEDNRLRGVIGAMDGFNDDVQVSATAASQTSAVLAAGAQRAGKEGIKDAVRDLVLQKFSKLVLVPVEKLAASLSRPLSEFGMDSMISAELRSWSWRELKADVPFMGLLEGGRQVEGLVAMVWEGMDPTLKSV